MLKDITCEVNASFLLRSIAVDKLMAVLKGLPADAELLPNKVGNLSIFLNDKEIGFVDLVEEKIKWENI